MSDPEKLKKIFDEKAEKLRKTSLKLNNNQKLKFYGLYKVVTSGKYSAQNKLKSGFFDFSAKYKNEAWEKCSIYTKEEAMVEYIKYYCELSKEKLPEELSQTKSTSKSISELQLNIPEGLDSQGLYSSTAKSSQEDVKKYLETAATENEKKFQKLKDKLYEGDLITEDLLTDFEKENELNLLGFRDNMGQSVLHIAVDAINFSAVDALIKINYGKDLINEVDGIGMTPMHIASVNFDLHIYDLLLTLNPDLKIKDNEGKTCKDYLKENEDCEVPKKYLRDE